MFDVAILIALLAFVCAIVMKTGMDNQLARAEKRIQRLETRVERLLQEHEIKMEDFDTPVTPTVQSLLDSGNKIAAIKAYRDQNPGVSLRDAKEVVETLEVRR